MTTPLARRLAGPSFSLNVRFDQAYMTKRREGARQALKLGECKLDFVSEYEVFDVAEGEILVSKDQPGRISDGSPACSRRSTVGRAFPTETLLGEICQTRIRKKD